MRLLHSKDTLGTELIGLQKDLNSCGRSRLKLRSRVLCVTPRPRRVINASQSSLSADPYEQRRNFSAEHSNEDTVSIPAL